MKMDEFVEFFHIFHSTDQPLCKQHQCEDVENVNVLRQSNRKMLLPRNMLLLVTTTL